MEFFKRLKDMVKKKWGKVIKGTKNGLTTKLSVNLLELIIKMAKIQTKPKRFLSRLKFWRTLSFFNKIRINLLMRTN